MPNYIRIEKISIEIFPVFTHSFPMYPFSFPWKKKTVREQRKGALGTNELRKKKKQNARKPHFNPSLGLSSPILSHIFFKILALLDVKLQLCPISRKPNDANLRNRRKT